MRTQVVQMVLDRPRPWSLRLAGVALATLTTCGCASFWEEVTSRNRDMKGYFFKPEPLVILSKSTDGAKRAQALAALREPLSHGGSKEEQEKLLQILTVAALGDPGAKDPLCRLGAIRAA